VGPPLESLPVVIRRTSERYQVNLYDPATSQSLVVEELRFRDSGHLSQWVDDAAFQLRRQLGVDALWLDAPEGAERPRLERTTARWPSAAEGTEP